MTKPLSITLKELSELAGYISKEKKFLLSNWKRDVKKLSSARDLDAPLLEDHMPLLLDELSSALVSAAKLPLAADGIFPAESPSIHGLERSREGYDIVEVVCEYKIMRSCIHELIWKKKLVTHEKAYQVLNRLFDNAIALAVQSFATNQALKVQRLREEYLSYLAHDLRSPLNAISLVLDIMSNQSAGEYSPKTLEMLHILKKNSQYVTELVENILKENMNVNTVKGLALERKLFKVQHLIDTLISELHPIAETSGTKINNKVHKHLDIFADPGLLKRIFENLVVNAIKFSPRGEITIDAREKEPGEIEFSVKDTGRGIASDRINDIFAKHDAKCHYEGTGLGLSIVKAYVEAHGGEIYVESVEGDGAVFRFTIPME